MFLSLSHYRALVRKKSRIRAGLITMSRGIKELYPEMENCLDNLHNTTCYELFRADNEVVWVRFYNDKLEIIREEQS